MPIPIQCAQCQQSYKVDDKLAGKKVKCKNCGASIPVPAFDAPADSPVSSPDRTNPDTDASCPNCNAPVQPNARLCLSCGFDLVTGRSVRTETDLPLPGLPGESDPAAPPLDLDAMPKKRKAWTRSHGSTTLESIDELIKLLVALLLLAGLGFTTYHIFQSPTGLTFPAILPTLITLALLLGLIAPLAAFSVNKLLFHLKILSRDDTYSRIAVILAFPFAVALLAGWPGGVDALVTLSWFLAVGLLIYLLRGDVIEWVASVLMAGAVFGVGAVLLSVLSGPINSITGPMYADMLPGAPWNALAAGHSPAPETPTTKPVRVAATAETPATVPQIAATQDTPPATTQVAATTQSTPAVTPTTQLAVNATGRAAETRIAPPPQTQFAAPQKIASPYFANILADEPGLRGIAELVVPAAALPGGPAPYFLAIKNDEAAAVTTIARWTISPLEKKGEFTTPYNPKFPSTSALSPKGDMVATLVTFPRIQLEMVNLDLRTPGPKRIITLTPPQPRAVPRLVGFIDATRALFRWDLDGNSGLSVWNINSGQLQRNIQLPPVSQNPNLIAINPNGHVVAILAARGKEADAREPALLFFNLDTGAAGRPVDPTPLSYTPIRLAFSPDANLIALYASIANVPTILSFKTTSGEAGPYAILANPPALPPDAAINHALQWLNNTTWLVGNNDVIDLATGRKLAALGILENTRLLDTQLVGPSSILMLTQTGPTEKSAAIARIDDAKLLPEKPR